MCEPWRGSSTAIHHHRHHGQIFLDWPKQLQLLQYDHCTTSSSCGLSNGHCRYHKRPPCLSILCSIISSCQTNAEWSDIRFNCLEPSLTRSVWSVVPVPWHRGHMGPECWVYRRGKWLLRRGNVKHNQRMSQQQQNEYVFSPLLKTGSDKADATWLVRLFHNFAQATGKAQPPTIQLHLMLISIQLI